MFHKRQSNKPVEDLAPLGEVLAIDPVSEFIMVIADATQDGLAKMKEASLVGYI